MNFKRRGIGFTQELAMEDERGVKDDPRISDLSTWKMGDLPYTELVGAAKEWECGG